MKERDLRDRLRRAPVPNANDAEQRTVSAAVARAEQRSARGREAGAAPRRPPRIRRIALLAGTGAIVLLVATAILRGAGEPAEADSFSSFAALAAEQGSDDVHHVLIEEATIFSEPFTTHDFRETLTRKREVWTGEDRGFVRRLAGEEAGFLTETDRQLWVERGRPETRTQRAPGISMDHATLESLVDRETGIGCSAPPAFDDTAMSLQPDGPPEPILCRDAESPAGTDLAAPPELPADPGELRDTLLEQLEEVRRIDEGFRELSRSQSTKRQREARPGELDRRWEALDLPLLGLPRGGPEVRGLTEADWIFAVASEHLKNPLASPELRAALFEVLADVEGVTLTSDREDRIGRRAAVIGFTGEPPLFQIEDPFIGPEVGRDNQRRFEIYVDPDSSQILEQRVFVTFHAQPGIPGQLEIEEGGAERPVRSDLFRHSSAESLPPSAARFEAALDEELAERDQPEQPASCEVNGSEIPDAGALQDLGAEHGQPARVTLTAGPNWRLIVTEKRALQARTHKDGVMISAAGSSAWTRPITLNEAGSYLLRRDGEPATVVAGPVAGDAVEVVVETMDGERVPASLADAYGLRWFWAEIGGTAWATAITACGADGEVVDVYDSPGDHPLIPHPMSFEIP